MGLILARFAFRLYAAKPRLKFRGVFCLLNRCWLFQFIQRRNNSLLFLLCCLNLQIPTVRENDLYARRVCWVVYRCVCADNVRGNSYIPHVDKQTFFSFYSPYLFYLSVGKSTVNNTGCNGWLNVSIDKCIVPVSFTLSNSSGDNCHLVIISPCGSLGIFIAGNGMYSGWSFANTTFTPGNSTGFIALLLSWFLSKLTFLFRYLNTVYLNTCAKSLCQLSGNFFYFFRYIILRLSRRIGVYLF